MLWFGFTRARKHIRNLYCTVSYPWCKEKNWCRKIFLETVWTNESSHSLKEALPTLHLQQPITITTTKCITLSIRSSNSPGIILSPGNVCVLSAVYFLFFLGVKIILLLGYQSLFHCSCRLIILSAVGILRLEYDCCYFHNSLIRNAGR